MEIIQYNAVAVLFRKAEELSNQPRESWKCVYFTLPQAGERQGHGLPAFKADVLSHIFARVKGFAYLCDNGEVFVLYNGAYNSLLSRLSAYLGTLHPATKAHEITIPYFSLFDLSRDWQGFYRLCEKRYIDALAMSGAMFASRRAKPVSGAVMVQDHVAGYLN